MTLLFLSLAGIIAIIVVIVSAKFIKAGFDARGEVKEEQRKDRIEEEILKAEAALPDLVNFSAEAARKVLEELEP